MLQKYMLSLCIVGIVTLIIYNIFRDRPSLEVYTPENILFINIDNLEVKSQDGSINKKFKSYIELNEFVGDITYELNGYE